MLTWSRARRAAHFGVGRQAKHRPDRPRHWKRDLSRLKHSARHHDQDARAFAEEFRRSDFDVDLKENVNKEEMRRAIDAVTNQAVRQPERRPALFQWLGYPG